MMSSDGPLERVLARLDGVEGRDGRYKALCPAHDDHNPSLDVKEVEENGQKKVLLKCWAGCETAVVLEKLNLRWKDLFSDGDADASDGTTKASSKIVAAYDYTDAAGNLLHQTVRFEPKRFSQRRPDGKGGWVWNLRDVEPTLYNLPGVYQAILNGETVFVVEGEKDADRACEELGVIATTCPMGAKKWRESYTATLRGANVVLIPDNDPAGRNHVLDVAERLLGVAASVKVLSLPGLPEKGDLSDWLDAGGTPDALNALLENTTGLDTGRASSPNDRKRNAKEDEEGFEGFEGEDWRSPISLDNPPLPEFPTEDLPEGVGEYVEGLATFTQTPKMLAGGIALGGLATACAKKVVIEPRPGWEEPPQLWTLTLLESGNRKTAVMQSILKPFDAWERERGRELRPRIAEAESRRDMLKQRKKTAETDAVKKRGSEAVEAENAALETARALAELDVPSPPQLITSDVTSEGAGQLCHSNDGRIAIWSDEGEIFKIVAGRYSRSQAPDVETFLKGHAGGDLRVNRVSRGMVKVSNGAVTMVLVVQPEVLASLNNQDTLRGLGFFARFLYGMPHSSLGFRDVDPQPVENAVQEAYCKKMTDLLNIEIPKDDHGEIEPHKIKFSSLADTLLKEFQRWVEPQLGTFGEMAALKEWGSKLAGAVVRIAGLLHVAEHVGEGYEPWGVEVSAETLKKAINIGCCYLQHSKAVLASMGADPRLGGARYLVKFIEHRGITRISTRDLFQKVKDNSRFETMEKLEPVLALLEEYWYVRKRREPEFKRGGRPKSPILEINPLSLPQNPRNPRNLYGKPSQPFFEWLAARHGLEDLEDPPPSGFPSEPGQNGHDFKHPPQTAPVGTHDTRGGDAGEEPNRKDGHEDDATGYTPSETGYETTGDYELVDGQARLSELATYLGTVEEVALDIETTGLSPFEDKVRLISLHAGDRTYFVDCFAVDPTPALEAMKDKALYVHGAEFDLPFLYHAYGFAPTETPVDTLQLSQIVRAGEWDWKEDGGWVRKKHSLKDVLKRELGMELGDKKKYQQGKAWTGDLTEEHLEYAAGDVVHLKPLAEKLFGLLQERGLAKVWELERRAKPLFLAMCAQGIPFDKTRWEGIVREQEEKVLKLKDKADKAAPPHPAGLQWNWFSPKQAKQAFSLAGLEITNLQRQTLSAYEDPFVRAVSEYRDAKSELSRARKWYQGRYRDGRVHPHWRPCGAATGRASCTDPNVQSLTTTGEYRGCVRPKDGRVLVKADVNQMELRVLAAVTGDETMLDVFRRGGDVNINTAEAITGRKVEKGDPERQRAKAVNFGLSYGMGAKRFLEKAKNDYGVLMSLQEAKEAKRKLLDTYPGISHWHRRQSRECQRGNFETRTLLGRRRVVEPDHEGKPKFTERLNAPVQGTGADILKTAMANLWERREEYPDALPILTVHDEIVVECEASKAEGVDAWLSTAIRDAISGVLGYPELAGEEAVETIVIDAWGDG